MNMFPPQSIQSKIEISNLSSISKNIISSRYSRPIIQLKQDTVMGAFQLTEGNRKIKWEDVMNIVANCKDIDISKIDKKDVMGTDLYSLILPDKLNITTDKVNIINGKLISGIINGSIMNSNIIPTLWDRYGHNITKDFIDNSQRLIVNYLLQDGFSVGLLDAIIDEEIVNKLQQDLEIISQEVKHLITEIENFPTLLDPQIFENDILNIVQTTKADLSGKTMKLLTSKNRFYTMIASKAKGKDLNMSQIGVALGQEIFKFKRIEKTVNNRTLVHFCQNDDTAESRGLIKSSYYDGLTPIESFFHHQTGREGLIDTAIKTADTGYLSRKLIKGLEDYHIAYDGTIRSSNNIAIQMLYGGSNLNQIMQKLVQFDIIKWGNNEINTRFKFTNDELNTFFKTFKYNNDDKKYLHDANDIIPKRLIEMRDDLRIIQRKALVNSITINDQFYQPANYKRIITDISVMQTKENIPLDPLYVIEKINDMMNIDVCRIICKGNNDLEGGIKDKIQRTAKTLFKIALYEYINPKRCINEYNFNKEQFDNVVNDIIDSFNKSIIEPGHMVGIEAAQSLGEPSTQMSVAYDTQILIQDNDYVNTYSIGEFIDNIMDKYANKLINTGHKDSYELDITQFNEYSNLKICGIKQDETVAWNKISHISRHPVNGEMIRITTASGRTVTTTQSHNFLIRTDKSGIIPIRADQLTINTMIPVVKNIKFNESLYNYKINSDVIQLDFEFGILCGIYLANGITTDNIISINYNNINVQSDNRITNYINNILRNYNIDYKKNNKGYDIDHGILSYVYNDIYSITNKTIKSYLIQYFDMNKYKHIHNFIHNTNTKYIHGILQGFFISCCKIDNNIFTMQSESEQLIKDISIIFSYFGIGTRIYNTISGLTSKFVYNIDILNEYINKFMDLLPNTEIFKTFINVEENNDNRFNIVPNINHVINKINNTLNIKTLNDDNIDRKTLYKYKTDIEELLINNHINKIDIMDELLTINNAINSDVIWDKITNIDIVQYPYKYVYDFTVPNNETFMTSDLICVHNTLNTFHSTGSGVSGMQGIPRLNELLNNTKTPSTPYMILYFDDKYNVENFVNNISSSLKFTILKDIVESVQYIYDENAFDRSDSYYNTDNIDKDSIFYLNNMSATHINNMPFLYRMVISKEAFVRSNIEMIDIKTKFVQFWDTLNDLVTPKKKTKFNISNIVHGCIMTTFDNSDELIIHFRFELQNAQLYIQQSIVNTLLTKLIIKGNNNIKTILKILKQQKITYDSDYKINDNTKEWIIQTNGIDMNYIRDIIGIDLKRTYCNDINTIYKTFGIEAARTALLKELTTAFSNNEINYAHMSILIDAMTYNGKLISMNRYGINNLDTAPLGRITFEKTMEQLTIACAFNEVDYLHGVSSRVMAGRCIKGGTCMCDIEIDLDIVQNSELDETKELKIVDTTFNKLEKRDVLSEMRNHIVPTYMPNMK